MGWGPFVHCGPCQLTSCASGPQGRRLAQLATVVSEGEQHDDGHAEHEAAAEGAPAGATHFLPGSPVAYRMNPHATPTMTDRSRLKTSESRRLWVTLTRSSFPVTGESARRPRPGHQLGVRRQICRLHWRTWVESAAVVHPQHNSSYHAFAETRSSLARHPERNAVPWPRWPQPKPLAVHLAPKPRLDKIRDFEAPQQCAGLSLSSNSVCTPRLDRKEKPPGQLTRGT